MSPTRHRLAVPTLVVLVSLAGLAACGDDEPQNAGNNAGDQQAAIARYCAGIAAAEKYGEEVFEGVDQDDEEALLAAERKMLDYLRPQFDRPQDLPNEIRADAVAFQEGFVTRIESGLKTQPTAEQLAAEDRVLAWEEKNCPPS